MARGALRGLLVGAWFALLALPIAGPGGSLLIGALVAAAVALYRAGGLLAGRPGFGAAREGLRGLGEMVRERAARLRGRAGGALLLSLLLVLPWLLNPYHTDVLTVAGIYVVLALGLNVVVGFAGLLDLGYVAFYAVGAYTYGLLSTKAGLSFWAVLPLGALVAAVFGVLLGVPVLRLRGDYLAIVTLGFGEMIRITLNNWDSLTNGPNGILGIGRPALGEFRFRHPMHFYYLILLLGLLAVFVVGRLNNSRIGRAWVALREDETAAECMGIDTTRAKLLAFALGATWAGLGGVFFAAKQTFISPESFTFFESVIILCMVVLGGMGSIPGVVVGAVILVVLPELLRGFATYRPLLFGATMVAMMLLRPEGLLSTERSRLAVEPPPCLPGEGGR